MKKLLVITASPNGKNSASNEAANYLAEKLKAGHSSIIRRDLSADNLPHVSGAMVESYYTKEDLRTPEHKARIATSDLLVDELLAADTIIIATPMWNFTMPSSLKAWFDHISRAGRTFTFGPEGVKGLLAGKKAYLVVSSGSRFSSGPFAKYDFLTPSLQGILVFLGITDTEVLRVEGTNDPVSRASAISTAKLEIDRVTA